MICHFTLRKNCALAAIVILLLFAAIATIDSALAQSAARSPFGVGDPVRSAPPATGIGAWLLAKQAELTRAMTTALRATRDGAGAWTLLSVAFLYGVFHAAGPGHGKAVVSSYVFANERTLRRGIFVAFAAAVVQALVAIALVVPGVLLLGMTARQIDAGVAWIEIIAFSSIALFGVVLTIRKIRNLRQVLAVSAENPQECTHCGGLRYRPSRATAAPRTPTACDHFHLPDAGTIARATGWKDLASVIVSAGARPCSGALILLAFALSVDALPVGILAVFAMAAGTAATTSGFAAAAVLAKGAVSARARKGSRGWAIAVAALELAAAVFLIAFAALLLVGYMSMA